MANKKKWQGTPTAPTRVRLGVGGRQVKPAGAGATWARREEIKTSPFSPYRRFWRGCKWTLFLPPSNNGFAAARQHGSCTAGTMLLPKEPGCYEFALTLGSSSKRFKVYVGETNNLWRRHHGEYRGMGDHLLPYFDAAVRLGCAIWRRCCPLATKEAAVTEELRWLSLYDYPWNAVQNGRKRHIELQQSGGCLGGGVTAKPAATVPWVPPPQYDAQMEGQRAWQHQLAQQQAAADARRGDLPPLPVSLEPLRPPSPPLPPSPGPLGQQLKEGWLKLRRASSKGKNPTQAKPQQGYGQGQGQRQAGGQVHAPLLVDPKKQRRQNVLKIFEEQQQQQPHGLRQPASPQKLQQTPSHSHAQQSFPPQPQPQAQTRPQSKPQWEELPLPPHVQQEVRVVFDAAPPAQQQSAPPQQSDTQSWMRQEKPRNPKWWQTREKYRNVNI